MLLSHTHQIRVTWFHVSGYNQHCCAVWGNSDVHNAFAAITCTHTHTHTCTHTHTHTHTHILNIHSFIMSQDSGPEYEDIDMDESGLPSILNRPAMPLPVPVPSPVLRAAKKINNTPPPGNVKTPAALVLYSRIIKGTSFTIFGSLTH